jgi:dTDP-glucose 4,6-dehydratase
LKTELVFSREEIQMQLLVTGGLGFIGSNLIRHLLKKHPNYSIINLDAVTYAGHPENLRDVERHPRYTFVKGRIEDRDLVDRIVSGKLYGKIDGIINLAAETHVDRSIHDPAVFVNTNVLGTQVLLEAGYSHCFSQGQPFRFVQVSTDEVYGSLGPTGFFTEETPLAPSSPYSASKTGGDLLARAYFHTFGMPVMITRCSNNYGAYQHPEKLIPLFITNLLSDKQVPVYGDGLNVRDWLHVDDHCSAIDLVFHKGHAGEVYNIGGHNERTNIEITKLVLAQLGKTEKHIKYVTDRPGHDRRYAIDSSKIQKELGWTPAHTFETGIVETINWYKENLVWLKSVTESDKARIDAVLVNTQVAAALASTPAI